MRLLKEPLLHFLILGGLLFAAHDAFGPREDKAASTTAVRITAADADWLKQMWTRQWRRPPTDEELARLVADHLREEVLAREAKALELDIDDTVIRRRLAQKMAFLLDGTIQVAEPPEAELRALYERRPDLVRTPPLVSFTQVFFRREHGDDRVGATLAALSAAAAAPEDQGDGLLLGDSFVDQDEQALGNLFGLSFARSVLGFPLGRWSGPVESSYGLHLIKVTGVSPSEARPFAEVRERLVEEWRRERQEAAQVQLLQGLMEKYQVSVDPAVQPFLGSLADQVEVRP
ncbi:peptidylprolyl isomerase [Microvirga yunnanensis]|uniref:peptidylprolyl isomerase n=1 Tax=Microvirga yunnanensis TaxID=2953740 RepID=UPI0021C6EDC2|nr:MULTISPECIES: peptidylprolyl isomerase [unclassified Microvirga]